MQTLSQLPTNLGPTSHQLWAKFAQILSQMRTNFRSTSHQLWASFALITGQHCTYFERKLGQTLYAWSNFVRSLEQVCIKFKATCISFEGNLVKLGIKLKATFCKLQVNFEYIPTCDSLWMERKWIKLRTNFMQTSRQLHTNFTNKLNMHMHVNLCQPLED